MSNELNEAIKKWAEFIISSPKDKPASRESTDFSGTGGNIRTALSGRKPITADPGKPVYSGLGQKQAERGSQQRIFDAFNMVLGRDQREDVARGVELGALRKAEEDALRQKQEYLSSEEYRKNMEQARKNAERQAWKEGTDEEQILSRRKDPREQEFQAKADYYKKQREDLEEYYRVTEPNLKELSTWSKEEQDALAYYAQNRGSLDKNEKGEPIHILAYNQVLPLMEKYGQDKVIKIAESYSRKKNAEDARALEEKASQWADSGPLGATVHSIGSVGANLLGTVVSPLGYLNEAMYRTGQYRTLDPNNRGNRFGVYSGAVRSTVAENIRESEGGALHGLEEKGYLDKAGSAVRELAALGYQGTMGAADNLLRVYAGGSTKVGSLGLAALGSFGSTLSEASAKGATPQQAVMLATSSAGIEMLTEYASIDKFLSAAKTGPKAGRQILKEAAKQGGIEVSEEELSFLLNLGAEAAILKDKSGYNQQIGELVANGMSYEQAKAQADRGLWDQAVQTAGQSFISGSVMSGAQSVGQNILYKNSVPEATASIPEAAADTAGAAARGTAAGAVAGISPETVGEKNAPAEKPQTITDEQIREADPAADFNRVAAEVAPRERVTQEPKGYSENVIRAAVDETVGARPENAAPQSTNETAGIKQQITASQETLASMEPVVQINTPREFAGMNIAEKMKWVIEKLRPTNYQVDRKGFGIINFSAKQIKQAFKYFPKGGAEEASFEAIPYVLENGTEISTHENHKGREYSTVTFAAPVTINGKRGNMAVVVKQTTDNRYKIHRVFSPDGSVFDLSETTIEAEPTPGGGVTENGSLATPISSASNNSIGDEAGNVNGQNGPEGAPEGFEAMGAADYNFSPYTRMQNEYGNIPEGENAVRPDDAPISTNGEDRVSYTARTAIGAEVTPDEFVPLIENEVVRGGFSFIPITNDESVQVAQRTIMRDGWETARANWTAAVHNGRTGPNITARGALLYNHAVNSGNYREAMDILLDYQQAVRNSARGLQAARILKTLTPANRLYMIRRSVQRMVEDMHLDQEITIDENLARRYQESRDDAEADMILDEIARDVARQIPSTFAERFTALRYLNMLGNFRTQGRNFVGNLVNQGLYMTKDQLSAVIEDLASIASNGRIQRNKVHRTDAATRQAAAADYDNVAEWISGGGRTNDRTDPSTDFERRVQENRRIFRNPLMEGYRRITDWAMNNGRFGDAAFGRAAYARALAGYLNARGIRTNDLSTVDPETLAAAREYAVRQAQEATFRDNNQVSDFVSGILRGRNTPAWARVIGEAIMPFRKTPANVSVRAEEFSPLGLINSAVNSVRAARGDISGAELIDSWAKTLTGTGLFAMGWALANMGFIRGGPDEDKEKAEFDKLNGYQNYSIQLPGGINFTIDAFSPTALPLLLGGQMDKILDGEMTWADLEGVFYTLADPMIEMSMLSGLNDTIDAIRYADNSLGQFLVNASFNYLTQALGNTLLGQIERSTEESRMTTYVDKDSNVPAWLQRNLGKLSQKFPGWDYNQTEYIDQWGREQKNPRGIANWLYNLLSPSYINNADVDAVAEELYRLHEVTGENVFPQSPETTITYTDKDGNRHEKYNLSAEEADKLKRVQGQTHAKLVADLTGNRDFYALTDSQKAKAAILCRDYARELARGEVLPGYDGKPGWMEGIEGNEAGSIIAKVAGADLGDAMSSLTTAWKEGYADDSEAAQSLEEAYQVYKGLSEPMRETVLEGLSERVRGYIEARDAGQSQESYLGSAKAVTVTEQHMDQLRDAWKEGEDGSAAFEGLDQAYRMYSQLTDEQKEQMLEDVTAKTRYFLEARAAGMKTETFTGLYQKYLDIEQREGMTATRRANAWAAELREAMEERRISKTQHDLLRESMVFRSSQEAEATRFDSFVEQGIDTDDAAKLAELMYSIKGTGSFDPETGKNTVRDVDRMQAVAGAIYLTTDERFDAMRAFMTEGQAEKMETLRDEFDLSASQYAAIYRAYLPQDKKAEEIAAYVKLGYSKQEAERIYRIYHSK